MGKAQAFFAMGDGVYARIFPATNFRKATEPVLQRMRRFLVTS